MAGALAVCLSGCVVVPRSAEVYDPQCRTMVRQMVLETAVIGTLGQCQNEGCGAMLATLGIVTAASAVISGSVAVIGNIVYWAERRGRCPPEPTESTRGSAPPDGAARGSASAAVPAPAASGVTGDPSRSRPPPPSPPPIVPGIIPFPSPRPDAAPAPAADAPPGQGG